MAEKLNYAKTVRAAKNGDRAALQDLYDATVNEVTALCRKLLNSSTDPDNVVIDTYLTLFESLDTLKPAKEFPQFAAKAAATQSYNANQLRPAGAQDLGAPQNALDVTEDTLNDLPNDQRTCLLLAAHGFSTDDIADVLGVTEYTVNSGIYFGKKKLQRAVDATKSTIDYSDFGVGNDVPDNLVNAYSKALYENVPESARAKQFNRVITLFEKGKSSGSNMTPSAFRPKPKAAPNEPETVVEEPKHENNFFTTNPAVPETPAEEPPIDPQVAKASAAPKKSKKKAPKAQPANAARQEAAASKPKRKTIDKVITWIIVALLVFVVVMIIVNFAHFGTGLPEEETTAPSSYSVVTTVPETTEEESTTLFADRYTEQQTRTNATTAERTEAPAEAPTTHAATTAAPQVEAPAAAEE